MSCDRKTPYADAEGMLPQRNGKLTIHGMKSRSVCHIVRSKCLSDDVGLLQHNLIPIANLHVV